MVLKNVRWRLGWYTAAERADTKRIVDEYSARQSARLKAFGAQVATWRCSICHGPIRSFSGENDYLCDRCGWTNPVRPDGGVVRGDGACGEPRLVRPLLPEINA